MLNVKVLITRGAEMASRKDNLKHVQVVKDTFDAWWCKDRTSSSRTTEHSDTIDN